MIFFASPFTVAPNARVNPDFKMTLHTSHNACLTMKMIVLLSVMSVLLGNHRITRIVGLIQIHVASLESVWTSMLHNRVSILK